MTSLIISLNEVSHPTNCEIMFKRSIWDGERAVLPVSPSTISSESSRKNSLSGGLLGRLRVFNSCWILVDTLLLTGTPGQTPRTATVTNICKQTKTLPHPLMHFYSNTNLYLVARSHTGLRTSTVRTRIGSRKESKGKIL